MAPRCDDQPGTISANQRVQQGDNILAIIELPGIDKDKLQIEAKENTIRILRDESDQLRGRRERPSTRARFRQFDRTMSIPMKLDPDGIKAEYRDGVLALFLPRAESDKPRSIKIK